MDVDAMQISNEERDKRIRQGLYFQCNKRGHIACNCLDKKVRVRVRVGCLIIVA